MTTIVKLNFFCQVYYPDSQASSQLFTDLLEGLSTRGYDIHVYCGKTKKYADGTRPLKFENRNGVKIVRCGIESYEKNNMLARGLAYFSFMASVALKLLFNNDKQRINFGVTNPPFMAWVLYLIKAIRGQNYYFMLLDVHPEGLCALGKLNNRNLLVKAWVALNKLAYNSSDKLIVIGRDMVPLLSQKYALSETMFTYIPHWSSVNDICPKEIRGTGLAKKLKIEDKFIVQYSGNMGLWHDLESIVEAANILKSNPEIVFLMIGNGIRRRAAQERSELLGLKNMIWIDFIAYSELEDSLSCSHLSFVSLKKDLAGVAVPCKLYGILASKRAVVGQVPSNSEVAQTIIENNCGWVVEPEDVSGLVETIKEAASNRRELAMRAENAHRAYLNKYTLAKAIDNISNVIESN